MEKMKANSNIVNMQISDYRCSELERLFSDTLTENGDKSFLTTGNKLIDILFKCEYYTKYPKELRIGNSPIEKLFSMFIRDPRHGLGYKNVGRELMAQSGCTPQEVVLAGGFKDFRETYTFFDTMFDVWQGFLRKEIESGNELAKKWCPRYASSNLMLARKLAKAWGMNKQEYGKFVKCNTVESKLSSHNTEEINFEHVPSKAMLKYYKRFSTGEDTKKRFAEYLASVKKGTAKLNVSVTNVYDILMATLKDENFDADLFFDELEKTEGNWLPIVDTSGSMFDANNSVYKAMAIGHYLGKTSTYCPNQVLAFSSNPHLITLGVTKPHLVWDYGFGKLNTANKSTYLDEIKSMFTGDCTNTNFGKLMTMLSNLKSEYPDYLVVLSDMQFDTGGVESKDALMKKWRSNGIETKIVWWNFNARNSVSTPCQIDDYGNVFLSGYSPILLKYLDSGFDGEKFLEKLLTEYASKIGKENG